MAAQEYYNPGGSAQRPYPLPDAPPPPYSAYQQRPASAMRPQSQPPYPNVQPHYSQQQYPPPQHQQQPPQQANGYQYPPQVQQKPPVQNGFQGPALPPPAGAYLGPPTQFNGYVRGSSAPVYAPGSAFAPDGRPRSRSRSRSRHHHHHHHHQKDHKEHKFGATKPKGYPSSVDTFIGAGGGALIGDAIFPGLGTLGGAILGGVGGHKYGERKGKSASRQRSRSRNRGYGDGDSDSDHKRRGRR